MAIDVLSISVFCGSLLTLSVILEIAARFFVNPGPFSIDINGGERKVETEGGATLLAALNNNKIFIPSACGGQVTCGHCKVRVMGPAHDYAKLLSMEHRNLHSCDTPPVSSSWLCLNRLIDVVFVVLLFGVAAWMLSTGAYLEPSPAEHTAFRTDAVLVGNWKSVDIVENPDAFDPGNTAWTDELGLKRLTFYPDGTTSGPWKWTQGDIFHPGNNSHAKYEIRSIDGQHYLFFEWHSGDVLLRHQSPFYYVLIKEVVQ